MNLKFLPVTLFLLLIVSISFSRSANKAINREADQIEKDLKRFNSCEKAIFCVIGPPDRRLVTVQKPGEKISQVVIAKLNDLGLSSTIVNEKEVSFLVTKNNYSKVLEILKQSKADQFDELIEKAQSQGQVINPCFGIKRASHSKYISFKYENGILKKFRYLGDIGTQEKISVSLEEYFAQKGLNSCSVKTMAPAAKQNTEGAAQK